MAKSSIFTKILIFGGILILLNYISNKFFLRLDFTADKRYTLNQSTKNILKELNKPVTVTAYFSENVPPHIEQIRKDFLNLLVEFEQRAGGNLLYEFINPNENEQSEMKAQQAGIQPVLVDMRERDQIKQQRVYLGAVVALGDGSEIIPVIQPGASMEYALATSIKKITVTNKPKIAFLQGHGETSLEGITQARQPLSVLYDLEPLTLTDTTSIPPNKYKTIAIVNPADTFPENHLNQLDQYLNNGGNIYIALNRVEGNLRTLQGEVKNIMLEQWLMKKGITVEDNFVRDAKCGAVTVRQQQGFMTFNSQMSFPFFPLISQFADHPITKGLEQVMMPFASTISFTRKDSNITIVPIAMTSKESGSQQAPVMFNVMQQWQKSDFPMSNLPVAVAVKGKFSGSAIESRMVIVGDGDFSVNGEGQQQQQLQDDNVNLMVNSIDWLSDDTGLIDLRTKGITARPIDQEIAKDETKKAMYKYSNVFVPILILVLFGFFRNQYQQKKRQAWMEDRY